VENESGLRTSRGLSGTASSSLPPSPPSCEGCDDPEFDSCEAPVASLVVLALPSAVRKLLDFDDGSLDLTEFEWERVFISYGDPSFSSLNCSLLVRGWGGVRKVEVELA
jgi:hypothetical protein